LTSYLPAIHTNSLTTFQTLFSWSNSPIKRSWPHLLKQLSTNKMQLTAKVSRRFPDQESETTNLWSST
jgi:hypothetical protein